MEVTPSLPTENDRHQENQQHELGRMKASRSLSSPLVGVYTGPATLEISVEVSWKTRNRIII